MRRHGHKPVQKGDITMKRTVKTAAIREPHNYWISRRVYEDETGNEFVKINGHYVAIAWLYGAGWDVDIVY